MRNVIETLRRVAAGAQSAESTDAELLERFIADRDEVAFEVLVRRHGPMVLGVCRRILGHVQDAEDAFQATFLVLVRKASSVAPREVVGSWLYSVARQTARKALAGNLRRVSREQPVAHLPEPGILHPEPTGDLAAVLDAEMALLPEAYRAAIVLCDLEGHTGRDAARQLGWPEGTLFTRLARGRKLLANRLARRGVSPFTALALPALPPALVTTTVQAASATLLGPAATAALVSPFVVTLTEGVLQAMIPLKLKLASAALVVLVLVGAAVAGGQYVQGPGRQPAPIPAPLAADPPQMGDKEGKIHRADLRPGQLFADLDLDGFPDLWIDLGFPLKVGPDGRQYKPLVAPLLLDKENRINVNRMIPHPTTNCIACHVDPNSTLKALQLLMLYQKNALQSDLRSDMLWLHQAQQPTDPHVRHALRWLLAQQQAQRRQQLEKLAENLDRETLLELLRLVERRDATTNAVRSLDQALDKVREDTKDPKAELATINALIKRLQERKEQLSKPPEPKKP
jgi:RNA polymerase sigma factor (sigma-70 family)